jgi:hypothetical protein
VVTATRGRKAKRSEVDVHEALARAEMILDQIHTFTDAISFHETKIVEARAKVTESKAAYDAARNELRELEDALDGTKDSLHRFLCPKRGQFMPLFDKMEDADEELHAKALEDLARYGIYPIRQILFYGPPGNGKTSAAQWLGKRLDLKVYRVAADALISAYLGKTGKNVTTLMYWLRSVGKAIVLFDEVEQLFPSREVQSDNCSQELQRAMAVFWQALDRWTTPQLFVFATNMPEKLDKALLSRFELALEFGPPTDDQVRVVIAYWAEIFHDHGADQWAPQLAEQSFESFRSLWQAISQCVRCAALG